MSLPTREAGMQKVQTSTNPLHPLCSKRQRASSTEDPNYIPEQLVYDHWKLNVIIYTIEVL
jgi:hypothetical protein